MSSWSIPCCFACVSLQLVFWLHTPSMRDRAGWTGFVWQTWWSLDVVMHPAQIWNHKRDFACSLVCFSTSVHCLSLRDRSESYSSSHCFKITEQLAASSPSSNKPVRLVNIFITMTSDHRQNGRFNTRVVELYGIRKSVHFWRSEISVWQVLCSCFCWWCTAVLKWCIQLMLSACGWCEVDGSTTCICHHLERWLSEVWYRICCVLLSLILFTVLMVKS